MTGLFEVLAKVDATEQERLSGSRAVIAVQSRVSHQFAKFIKAARNSDDFNARLGLADDEIQTIVASVCAEYDFDDVDLVYQAALQTFGGGHPSGCDCGFCKNKGKLPGTTDDDEELDSDDKEATDEERNEGVYKLKDSRVSFDYPSGGSIEGEQADPSGPGGPIGEELSEKKKGDNDEELGGPIGQNLSEQKGASIKRSSMNKRADGFAQCDCDCEGCDSGTHCESNNCIQTKRSGPKGLPQQASYDWEKVAADIETGDTYTQESVDLPTADNSGLGSEGSPKIDKGKVPKDGLKAIDVPSKRHPSELQDLGSDTPDYWKDLPGPSETGKSIDADSPLQPEHNTAPNTDTWSGTEGQASPVTSKWIVLK